MKAQTRQTGFVLILIVLSMLAVLGTVLLVGISGGVGGTEQRNAANVNSQIMLEQVKSSLMGYVIQVTDGGEGYRMGGFPTPDVLNTTGTTIQYDGIADTNCMSVTASGFPSIGHAAGDPDKRCIGKFPWKDFGLSFGTTDAHDPLGLVPWLAVSPNVLKWDECVTILNSELLGLTYAAFNCDPYPAKPATLPYPWFIVRDGNGSILSDRVAAVLIIPGAPIANELRSQARTSGAPGGPKDYLDPVRLPLGCQASCTMTIDNGDFSGQFVSLYYSARYPINSENIDLRNQAVPFNDVLIYITIDEVMAALETRVLAEMQAATVSYRMTNTVAFPWPAPFAQPTSFDQFLSQPSSASASFGLFPFLVKPEASAPPPPYPEYPSYLTEFDWNIRNTGTSNTNCIESLPGRFFDSHDALAIGSTRASGGSCVWKGTNDVSCRYESLAPEDKPIVFNRYSTLARCRSKTNPPIDTEIIDVTISSVEIDVAPTCSNPTINYAPGSASQYGFWSWSCAVVGSQFGVTTGTYSITSKGITQSGVSIFGAGRSVSISRMRYQPIMPYWYYYNEWYRLGFLGAAPVNAPANLMPCGPGLQLTVDGVSGYGAVVVLAGSKFPNPPLASAQNRPDLGSAQISDYLEGANVSASTNCTLISSATNSGATNDRLFAIKP